MMRLGWAGKVALGAALPVFLGLGAFGLVALDHVQDLAQTRIESGLLDQARILALTLDLTDGSDLQGRTGQLAKASDFRVTVIDASGVVVADSDADPATMENHGSRPEVVAARAEGAALRTRYSRTVKKDLVYAAARVGDSDVVVRVARDFSSVQAELAQPARFFWLAAGVVVLIGAAIAILFARRMARPVGELTRAAVAVARGDLDARVYPHGKDEIARLGEAFNRMTERLRKSIYEAEAEAARLAAILQGMNEGVVAVDSEERIAFLNRAARAILGLGEGERVEGSRLYEKVREPRVLGIVQSAAGSGEAVESEFQEEGPPRKMIRVHAVPVAEKGNVILVLRDMSRLRRLERMRSDFVSNVSHELRTPLAGITAAIETLEDDENRSDPDTGPRFVAILRRNASRLEALLDDILALSRFESRPETLNRVPLDFAALVRSAADDLNERARAAEVELICRAEGRLMVVGDGEALRRVADNLILNAILYTPEKGTIEIDTAEESEWASLRVKDTGIGIPEGVRERIFERFFRVDKARSRSAGGTGLGLAIVKHAVGLHRGVVEVESTPGVGSTFTVRLPLSRQEAPDAGAATAPKETNES